MPFCHSPFVLGTVQLGIPYGIANKTGQPSQVMATNIIRTAWENGIREFDTAQDYGLSELVLGNAFRELGISREVKVISKFDPVLDHLDSKAIHAALEKSLNLLNVPSLHAIMIHNEDLLPLWSQGLGDIIKDLRLKGKVKKAGFSVYTPGKAIDALSADGVDLVQVPTSILDRRFENAGVFRLAEERRKDIYVRSVFLQGLILMKSDEVKSGMEFARPVLDKIDLLTKKLGVTRQEIALGYFKEELPGVKLVIGVDTPEQIIENKKYWEKEPTKNLVPIISKWFSQIDEKVLNPMEWSK